MRDLQHVPEMKSSKTCVDVTNMHNSGRRGLRQLSKHRRQLSCYVAAKPRVCCSPSPRAFSRSACGPVAHKKPRELANMCERTCVNVRERA